MILEVEKIRKAFGGFAAINGVSFGVKRMEVSSIIGPNGAGKTTLFNILSGRLPSDEGRILFKGNEITASSAAGFCKLGIGRSFQRTNIFPRLSVFDNVQVALMTWARKTTNMFTSARFILHEETHDILNSVGLRDKTDMMAGLLSHGDQRRLEIGISLGSHPELLLLDEPTAGMGPDESNEIVRLIQRLAIEKALTLVFIEHDMNMVFAISNKIRVMSMGRIIAAGSPEEIRKNSEVQRIYLAEAV